MAILAPVVFVLLPLLILPGALFHWDVTPKVAVLLFGTALALLFFDSNARAVRALLTTRHGRWFAVLLACQLASLILSTLTSTSIALSIGGANWRRYGLITQAALAIFALLLAGHFSLNPSLISRVLRATAIAGCGAALYGIMQYFGWDPFLPASSYRVGEGTFAIVRPPSTFGHAAYFSTYLLYGLFAGIALRRQHRWLSLLTVVIIPTAILLSGTRAALLGLLVGLAALILLTRPRLRTIAITGALALASLVALWMTPAGERLRARVRWSIDDAHGGARLLLWRDSIRMSGSHLLAGTGLETFGNSFPKWQSEQLARQFPDFLHESPHNLFLDALNSQGLPGLLVWLGLCTLPLLSIRKEPALGAGWVAALVSMHFSSPTIATVFGLFCLAAAILPRHPAPPEITSPPRLVPLTLAVAFALAGLLLVIPDQRLQAMKTSFDAGQQQQAATAYLQASRWALPGGNDSIYYSRRMAASGRWAEALDAARAGIPTAEDRQNAYYNLAVIQAGLNNGPGVESSLRSAISISPNWFKPHWTLAQVLALQGRFEEAERHAAIAAGLAGARFPEVAETLSQIRLARRQAHFPTP